MQLDKSKADVDEDDHDDVSPCESCHLFVTQVGFIVQRTPALSGLLTSRITNCQICSKKIFDNSLWNLPQNYFIQQNPEVSHTLYPNIPISFLTQIYLPYL